MAEWSEDYMAAIDSIELKTLVYLIEYGYTGDWVGPLGGKWRTIGWNGRGVV
jgi:hypothetical protein